jgi:hypothetical protein
MGHGEVHTVATTSRSHYYPWGMGKHTLLPVGSTQTCCRPQLPIVSARGCAATTRGSRGCTITGDAQMDNLWACWRRRVAVVTGT